MYTNKNKILIDPIPNYRYLSRSHEENLLINGLSMAITALNIEILSGNISINIIDENNFYCKKIGNNYLYIVNKGIFSLNIKSNNNSLYLIYYSQGILLEPYITHITEMPIIVGGNYLYDLERQKERLLFSDLSSILDIEKENNPIFVGINSFCRINITEKEKSIQNILEFNGQYFYQDIASFNVDILYPQKRYSVNITENLFADLSNSDLIKTLS